MPETNKSNDLDFDFLDDEKDLVSNEVKETIVKKEVPVQPAKLVETVAPQVKKEVPVQPATTAKPIEEVSDMGPGVIEAPIGKKFSSLAIPRFKATKDTKYRIAVMSKNAFVVKTHYVKEVGSFRCWGGKCCEIEGNPRVKYCLPIVVYEDVDNKTGKPMTQNITCQLLVLGGESYDAICTLAIAQERELNSFDVMVTCSDEQYQKLSFAALPTCEWKHYDGAKALVEYYKAHKKEAPDACARYVSESTYLARKGFTSPADSTNSSIGKINTIDDALDVD